MICVQDQFNHSESLTQQIFCRTSQVAFKASKNHGYFDDDDLFKQVELGMDIFEDNLQIQESPVSLQ
jgi:hypothetical protein